MRQEMTNTEIRLECLKQAVAATKDPRDVLPTANDYLDWVTDKDSRFEEDLGKWIRDNPDKADELVKKITEVQEANKGYEVFMDTYKHWEWDIPRIKNPLTGLY